MFVRPELCIQKITFLDTDYRMMDTNSEKISA